MLIYNFIANKIKELLILVIIKAGDKNGQKTNEKKIYMNNMEIF